MAPLRFAKQIFDEFSRDKLGQLSAAFAYMALFSIGPLLLVLISTLGFIFGEQAVEGNLFSQLSSVVGPETAKTLQDVTAHTYQSGGGILALLLGTIGVLLGATGISGQLENSFNSIFQAVPDPKGGIKRTVYAKIKNLLVIIVGGVAVAASVVASTIIIGLGAKLQERLGTAAIVLEIVNNLSSLVIFVVIFYLIYRVLPDVQIPRKVVVITSIAVACLFMVGKIILGIVIGNNATASAYGAAASLVTLLLWIYYSGQILFVGAEGIKVYGHNHSLTYAPKRYNLKRSTLHLDAKGFSAKLIESFTRGFKKGKR